ARAAHDGVAASLLARAGFTAAEDVLEARYGFLELYTARAVPERLAGAPGATAAAPVAPEQVERVEATVNPYTATVTAKPDPTTGLEAKFSAQHCLAVALVRRRGATLEDFTDEAARDPA